MTILIANTEPHKKILFFNGLLVLVSKWSRINAPIIYMIDKKNIDFQISKFMKFTSSPI
ncbi:MAG: hypothetical protein LBT77_00765 [Mycoplasmataceae bacterium]|nr:hypothetical protein [Mycoplasmataceae bacterium]